MAVWTTYDSQGDVESRTRETDGRTEGAMTYTYDSDGNLDTEKSKDVTGNVLTSITYGYNDDEQVSSESGTAGDFTYSYNSDQEMTGDGINDYSYDNNGNRSSDSLEGDNCMMQRDMIQQWQTME